MIGRRTVWSDAKIRELSRQFVLAADEVWRLQGGQDPTAYRARGGADPECLAFQAMAGEGHYGAGAGTRQGIYVCTPDARFLASINSNRPDQVAAMLTRGLERWRALSEDERAAAPRDTAPEHRFEWARPEGGLELAVTMRYLPDDGDPASERLREYNHDALWFTAAEARRFLPEKPETGATHTLPDPLFQRIARFNLVDAVRGETRPNGTAEGSLRVEVTGVDGDLSTLRLTGEARARGRRSPLRIRARLFGEARFDRKTGRFAAFAMVATGDREVQARTDGRGRQRLASLRRIGWLFELAAAGVPGARAVPTDIRGYPDWGASRSATGRIPR